MLGPWSITRDGKDLVLGPNTKAILHALIMTRGTISRDALTTVLPDSNLHREDLRQAVRNALYKLRRRVRLEIVRGDPEEVVMHREQAHASIDLWEFFDHVERKEYMQAAALIEGEAEPRALDDEATHNDLWATTFERFRRDRDTVMEAIQTASARHRSMREVREHLLDRILVPGVGRQVQIREVRERVEPILFPWRSLRPDPLPQGEGSGEERFLPTYLSRLLADDQPRRAIVLGGPGAGKTLSAIGAYLQLTDHLEDPDAPAEPRTVLFVDAHREGSRPDFATDVWLERRLRGIDAVGHGRPIVIVPHADAFLSRPGLRLDEVLGWRLFRECDVLLCCSDQFYFKGLQYEEYGTHVVRLESWDAELQRSFAAALVGEEACERFVAWRDEDRTGTRERLCAVPLHLIHVLWLVASNPDALERISTQWHLFDQVARIRLRVAGQGDVEDDRRNELAAVAHRFYEEAKSPDRPIGFNLEELRDFLRGRNGSEVEARVDAMVNRTLLTVPVEGSDEFHFEEPSWGWFFVAFHLAQTLMRSDPPEGPREAFAKFLSADVMELCEEMLREAMGRHEARIVASLRKGLFEESETDLSPGRQTIAREQLGYLLGMLGSEEARAALAPLVDPESGAAEEDDLVRRGIVFGLANAGAPDCADRYVEALREELASGGETPQRDANVGFLLSFRGDQPFRPEHPGWVGEDLDPVRTVADLVRALEEERHRGSWRIKLFTLVDLGRHPAVSAEAFEVALGEHRERLGEILARLAADPVACEWPELAEAGELFDGAGKVAA